MATYLTIQMVAAEATRLWKNTNNFMRNAPMQYDDQYANSGWKIGGQLRLRLPVDFTVRTGAAASPQDINETFTTLTLGTQKGVDVTAGSLDLTLSIDMFAERYLAPAINNLAGAVAVDLISGTDGGVSNFVDNEQPVGTLIYPSSTTVLTAGALLDTCSAPVMNRRLVVDPFTDSRVTSALAGLFNPVAEISDQYRSGAIKNALGFDWLKDQTVIKHTSGTFTAGTVSGAGQTGTAITTAAITGTLNRGDIITIAGVNRANRITKADTGRLMQFVVVTAAASGATTLNLYPPIIPPSGGNQVQYQTVMASPANAAPITLLGPVNTQYIKNVAFVPEAMTMATADLVLPKNKEAARSEYEGVSMRIVTDYLIGTDVEITRLDVVYGYLYIRPEWMVCLADSIN
jgi:P22 coat protein - gene protein 5